MGIATESNYLVTQQGLLLRRADVAGITSTANDAGVATAPNASAATSDVNAIAVSPTITTGSGLSFAAYKAAVTAEMRGFGAYGGVTGGLNGSLYVVSTTANSGVGSLRDALSGSNRWIVFSRSVFPKTTETTISLSSSIDMRNVNNVTVDGFGARVRLLNYGITTADWLGAQGVSNECNNLCFLNFKHGGTIAGNFDCLTIDGTDKFWLYHLECTGGGDGNVDITQFCDGPSVQGYATVQNCYIHHAKTSGSTFSTGKNSVIGNQSLNTAEYVHASSSYPANGGKLKLTIVESRFSDRTRNPVIANAHVDFLNNLVDDYEIEGVAIMGLMGHLRARRNVIDGLGSPNPTSGIKAWTFGYPDTAKKYKRWALDGNLFLNGAAATDASGGFLNPAGSIYTLPYTDDGEVASTTLQARLKNTSVATQGRAGCVDRDGYFDLVT